MSTSISEFWRRWHISLGSWFRDYLYFPLGGSRVSKSRNVFNLFAVWSLTGLWHGANFTFIAWGLMYFVLIAMEKLTGFDKKQSKGLMPIKWLYTILFVVLWLDPFQSRLHLRRIHLHKVNVRTEQQCNLRRNVHRIPETECCPAHYWYRTQYTDYQKAWRKASNQVKSAALLFRWF